MPRKREADAPEPIDESALTIFVDGSMRNGPRRGGIGIRFVWVGEDGHEAAPWDHALPATEGATIQEMELEAPYRALMLAIGHRTPFLLSDFDKVEIRTDSDYVKEGVGRAIKYWSRNGWNTSEGKAVMHVKDWKNLLRLMRRLQKEHGLFVNFEWKKGKKGKHARAVDKLARQSSDSPSFGQKRPSVVRRKWSPEQVDLGSVRMEGQVITVRIVQAQYLPAPHRRSRYKYEVVNRDSLYFQKLDWAESNHGLKRGHTFEVRMNNSSENPRIEEVLREVEEDLTPYLDTLRAIGAPATAKQVANELERAQGLVVSPEVARRRLERLVGEQRRVLRTRASSAGRPYLFELTD